MSAALVAALARLLDRDGDLPASALSSSQSRALEELARSTGAVQKIPSGRGSAYRASNPQLLRDHLRALRPHARQALEGDLPQRAINIGTTRDSKRPGQRHGHFYLLAKSIGEGVHWQRGSGTFDLSASTAAAGAGAISVSADDDWSTDAPVWLVENQALFDRTDWFPGAGPATLVYYAGQLHGELLRWLAVRTRTPELVLFADYDGVGLLNYARLREVSASPCQFWLMPGWRELLSRYGNQPLWQRTRPDFERAFIQLSKLGMASELEALCRAMSSAGLALEHEVVWLSDQV